MLDLSLHTVKKVCVLRLFVVIEFANDKVMQLRISKELDHQISLPLFCMLSNFKCILHRF